MCDSLYIGSVDVRLRQGEGTALGEDQREQLNALLEEFAALFNKEGPPTTVIEPRIETGDAAPISTPPYCLSLEKRAIIKAEVQELLRKGDIEESDSSWASNVVLGKKKDGSNRVCIDFRALNKVTVPDPCPMPRIDNLLHASGKASVFSSFDLQWGYWLIPLRVEDRP